MARIARLIIPGVPHHVTQRGNRSQQTFFCDNDYRLYRTLMAEACRQFMVEIWAYCLMPNHVHLIAVPKRAEGLTKAISLAHLRYTLQINRRNNWKGCLWQGRYFSCPMDDAHLYLGARYVESNPVRAGLVQLAWEWPWSSALAHVYGVEDELVHSDALLKRWPAWRDLLLDAPTPEQCKRVHQHASTGRPLGTDAFVRQLEAQTGRTLVRLRGQKPPTPDLMETCYPNQRTFVRGVPDLSIVSP